MIQIKAENTGPLVDTEFEYAAESPGLHIIEGRPGAGKTTILRSIEWATTGRSDIKPTKSDGAKRGTVEVAGKTLKITKRISEEGELAVEGLDDLDLASLHAPHFKTAATRDAHRIKALCRLAGADADASLFHELLGGREQFDQVVDENAVKTDDIVEMQARIKTSIEKAARAQEGQRDVALANMRARKEIAESVDTSLPHGATELQLSVNVAVANQSRLQEQARNAVAAHQKSTRARTELEKVGIDPDAVRKAQESVRVASVKVDDAADMQVNAQKLVDDLNRQLEEAFKTLDAAKADKILADKELESSQAALSDAELLHQTVQGWKADIDTAANVKCPSEEELAEADRAVGRANAAVELGVKIRDAIVARTEADHQAEIADQHDREATRLRNAARDTFDVLSAAIGRLENCPLSVRETEDGDPRLVLATDRSDAEYFDELSDSERWEAILPLCGGENRLLVLSQEAFGGLNDSQRDWLDRWAEQNRTYVLSALNVECELRGRRWERESVGVA